LPLAEKSGGRRVVSMIRYPIQPGAHTVKLYARDLHSSEVSDSLVFAVDIPLVSGGELSMSHILVASSISPEQQVTDAAFHKNSMRVVPNPSAIFGTEQPMLFYYLEIYNLLQHVSGPTYRTKAFVVDQQGEPAPSIKPRIQTKAAMGSTVEVGAVNISALPSGTYFLHFDLLGAEDAVVKSAVKKFYIYNPQSDVTSSPATGEVETVFFSNLTDQQIEKEVGYVRYLFNEAERLISVKLSNPQGKRDFLMQFWSRFARTAAGSWQGYRQKYLERVDYANKNFKSFAREGWMSDRGRVYLLYDKPDDIEAFPSTSETKPYEVWTYNGIEGGVEFIFSDRTGFREYQLLHSTKLGEVKNENWREQITTRP
jgi:GWxTD domain-containing protein